MKGYYRIKLPKYKRKGIVPDAYTDEMYNRCPYIYLSEDFSHYLSKSLMVIPGRWTIGGTIYRGFRTYYIIDKSSIVKKIKVTKLSKLTVKDVLKEDDNWMYVIREDLRLG